MVIAGGIKDGTRGRAIKDPADTDVEDNTGGVDPGVDASNAIVARSIIRYDILDTSFRRSDGSNKAGRSS